MVLTTYIEAALRRAVVDRMVDPPGLFAEIPGFLGVWATGDTAYAALEQLREVLEDWIVLQLRKNIPLPEIDGVRLSSEAVPA